MDIISLYVHIPFCKAKCAYCDFNSYAGLDHLFESYVKALVEEMESASDGRSVRSQTIYLGGGTPTVLPLSLLRDILCTCHRLFFVSEGTEITVEANPGTVDRDYLAGLLDLGVNRLSLGVQSSDDGELRLLGRIHTAKEAIEAYQWSRKVGFTNINLDFLYGIPYQTLEHWQETLRRALSLQPEHLSLYCLTLEEHTPLAQRIVRGEIPAPDDDLAADMYILAEEMLAEAGYVHYEISNWARPDRECRHNLTYWRNQPYLGFGAGAHSYFEGRRWRNVLHPRSHIERLSKGESPIVESEEIGEATEMAETAILGLRLVKEGLSPADFESRFGRKLKEIYSKELEELKGLGLIEMDEERVRLTAKGRLLGNEVFERFLP